MFEDVPRESPACWAPTNVNPQADRSLALHHQFVVRAKFPRKRRACDPLPPGEAYESHILSVCLRTRKGEKGKGGRRNLSRGSSGLSRSPPRLHRPRATTPLPQVSPTPIPYSTSSKHGHLGEGLLSRCIRNLRHWHPASFFYYTADGSLASMGIQYRDLTTPRHRRTKTQTTGTLSFVGPPDGSTHTFHGSFGSKADPCDDISLPRERLPIWMLCLATR